MRTLIGTLLLAFWLPAACAANRQEPRILKVLPHLLDEQGRHALSPSLYERDSYQAGLRSQPARVSGVRFDVNWRARGHDRKRLSIRLELRTALRPATDPLVVEGAVKTRDANRSWAALKLDGADYRANGEVVAWRAVLLEDGRELAEQKSFLW